MNDTIAARPRVLVFRNELLPASETFILAQARALRSFEPVFAGVHPAPRMLAGVEAAALVAPAQNALGKVKRRLYWRTGMAPAFHARLRRLRPALIHAHFALDGAAALPLQRALNVPLMVTLHGYDVSSTDAVLRRSNEGRLYLRRRQDLWQRASVFLCISEFIREKALQAGFPAQKLRVHYTGTDMKMFERQAAPHDANTILFVGRFVEKKGCTQLLDALNEVRGQHQHVRLIMIGSGPLEPMLRQRVAEERLPCEFMGMQPAAVVKQQMARARVFCVPSVTASTGDSEGLGMVFAEAQAMGTPVASFRHGGIAEVVRHGETGLLAPERNTRALAANLLCLLRDEPRWCEFARTGVEWVRSQFDIERQTAQLERIYATVVEEKSRFTSTASLVTVRKT